MEQKNLQSGLIALIKSGFNIEFPILGQVTSVNVTDKIVKIKSGDEVIENVRYYDQVKPAIGSNALVVFRNNIHDRSVALAFDKLAEVEIIIAQKANILIDDQECTVTYDDDKSVTLQDNKIEISYRNLMSVLLDDDGITLDYNNLTQVLLKSTGIDIKTTPASNVTIGGGAQELIALGEKLKVWLEALVGILTATPLVTDPISGVLPASPALVAALNSHKGTLDTILSKNVKAS